MSDDYFGIDMSRGRWFGPVSGIVFLIGFIALVVLAVSTGQAIGD